MCVLKITVTAWETRFNFSQNHHLELWRERTICIFRRSNESVFQEGGGVRAIYGKRDPRHESRGRWGKTVIGHEIISPPRARIRARWKRRHVLSDENRFGADEMWSTRTARRRSGGNEGGSWENRGEIHRRDSGTSGEHLARAAWDDGLATGYHGIPV